MSQLVYTATFVRMGRSPFGTKPKEATVFAQHLEGGSALTVFHCLSAPGVAVRIRDSGASTAQLLMAGFALAEAEVPLQGAAVAIADRLRKGALDAEVELTVKDAQVLADAVKGLDVALYVTAVGGGVDLSPQALGDWAVRMTSITE